MGLLPRILIAILLGALCGLFFPLGFVKVFVTFNSLFSNLLQFFIPLIIIGLVTPAIAEVGDKAGKLLLITVTIAYLDTVFAGFLSYFTSVNIFPGLITGQETVEGIAEAESILPYFTVNIPAMFDVMSSLVFAFTVGLGIAFFKAPTIRSFAGEFRDIIAKAIEVVLIPLLPIYIFGIILNMAHTGQALQIFKVFVSIIGVIFVLHLFLLLLQYSVAGVISGKNPFISS